MLPSPSLLAHMTKSLVMLSVVSIVVVGIVAEVDVLTKVVGEPLEPRWVDINARGVFIAP